MRRAVEIRERPPVVESVPIPFLDEPSPSDALPLNDVIDQRFRQLFSLCTDPKDIIKALEAATAWVKVRTDTEGNKGWGDALKGGTMR